MSKMTKDKACELAGDPNYLSEYLDKLIELNATLGKRSLNTNPIQMPIELWNDLHERGFKVYARRGHEFINDLELIQTVQKQKDLVYTITW